MSLSPGQQRRYARQVILPEVGPTGQAALARARVLIVGLGGLGCPAALYLAAGGVGTLGLVDHDVVDEDNLHRQILYGPGDVGRRKVEVARQALARVAPEADLVAHDLWLAADNAAELIGGYDLVVNGCDNFATRYLVSDACVLFGKPCVDGSVFRFEGQVTVYHTAAGGPCYRCRFPEPPLPGQAPSCSEAGVLGALPGVVGTLQAVEALKLLLARAGAASVRPLIGRVLAIDAATMEWTELPVSRDPNCPVCGDSPTITSLVPVDDTCAELPMEVTPNELAARLGLGEQVLLVDVREPWEFELCRLEGACLVPLKQIPVGAGDLPVDVPLVTYCHKGVRSLEAATWLRAHGFAQAQSLRGGIDAWSVEIDPRVPRYGWGHRRR